MPSHWRHIKGLCLQDAGAGLVAAAMIAVVPGYISRSVAGSYDNEGIAIFCMLLTYALWIKAVKTGSLFWSVLCALAYFYMVSILCCSLSITKIVEFVTFDIDITFDIGVQN